MIYITFGLVVLSVLWVWIFSPLGTSDRVGITTAISMVALFIVTSIYAWHTRKMAEEMREQRLTMYKPSIVAEYSSGNRGKYFMREIGLLFVNSGTGTAINIELYIAHPHFKFTKFRYPRHLAAGQKIKHDFSAEEPSVDNDPRIKIDPKALAVADYDDVFGNPWHSTLELHWDAASRDIKPGHVNVGISGHYHFKRRPPNATG